LASEIILINLWTALSTDIDVYKSPRLPWLAVQAVLPVAETPATIARKIPPSGKVWGKYTAWGKIWDKTGP
jgi:hypothetical protein